MKKNVINVVFINVIIICCLLFSYYIKKNIGYVLYNWIIILFLFVFSIYSLIVIFTRKKKSVFINQFFCCVFLCLMIKLDIPDRFALLVEVPKFERKIESMKRNRRWFNKVNWWVYNIWLGTWISRLSMGTCLW